MDSIIYPCKQQIIGQSHVCKHCNFSYYHLFKLSNWMYLLQLELCVYICIMQEGYPEVLVPCHGEQRYARYAWLWHDWPRSFICSNLWQLAEDAGNSDEIQVPNFLLVRNCPVRFFLCIFRCNIPVVIIGETGCGKTRLVRYMCQLQARLKMNPQRRGGALPQTFFILKVSDCFFQDVWEVRPLPRYSRYMVELQRMTSSLSLRRFKKLPIRTGSEAWKLLCSLMRPTPQMPLD